MINYSVLGDYLTIHSNDITGKTIDQIVAWCNETLTSSVPHSYWMSFRTLGAILGVSTAATIRATLKALSTSSDPAAPLYDYLYTLLEDLTGGGLDISLPEAQAYIDQFVSSGLITADQGNTIKVLGQTITTYTRMSSIGLGIVNSTDILNAQGRASQINTLSDLWVQKYQKGITQLQDILADGTKEVPIDISGLGE
jgi:hypothetical protein